MILVSPSLFHFLYFALLLHLVEKGRSSVRVQDDVKCQKCLFLVQSSTTSKNGTQTTFFRRIPMVTLSTLYSSQGNIYVNFYRQLVKRSFKYENKLTKSVTRKHFKALFLEMIISKGN